MADEFDELVEDILDALHTRDPELRRQLRESLERGLDLALHQAGTNVEIQLDLDGNDRDVVVLEGGREGGDPTEGPAPDLHVVDDDDHADAEGLSDVEVRFHRLEGGRRGGDGEVVVEDAVQMLFAGPTPRLYRVHCRRGRLTLLAEGQPIGQLVGGQSSDVEATLVQVRGTGEGTYHPVSVTPDAR